MGEDVVRSQSATDRARQGEQVFQALAGPGDTAPWDALASFAPALGEHIKHGLGTLVARPELDLRTRELVTIALLGAMGNCESQLAFHVGGALRAGATRDEVLETLMQVSIYGGIPRAINALVAAQPALAAQEAVAA